MELSPLTSRWPQNPSLPQFSKRLLPTHWRGSVLDSLRLSLWCYMIVLSSKVIGRILYDILRLGELYSPEWEGNKRLRTTLLLKEHAFQRRGENTPALLWVKGKVTASVSQKEPGPASYPLQKRPIQPPPEHFQEAESSLSQPFPCWVPVGLNPFPPRAFNHWPDFSPLNGPCKLVMYCRSLGR